MTPPSPSPRKRHIKRKATALSLCVLTTASIFLSPTIAMAADEPMDPSLTIVTPIATTFNDEMGKQNDNYVIPSIKPEYAWPETPEGTEYYVNGNKISAGTWASSYDFDWAYDPYAKDTITVEIKPVAGYAFPAGTQTVYEHVFDASPYATPTSPIFSEGLGLKDTVTIPNIEGIRYRAGRTDGGMLNLDAGILEKGKTYDLEGVDLPYTPNYSGENSKFVYIVAEAEPGYTMEKDPDRSYSENHYWYSFSNAKEQVSPEEPRFVDVNGKDGDSYTIPASDKVTYSIRGEAIEAGTYPASKQEVAIQVEAKEGYEIIGQKTSFVHYFDFTTTLYTIPAPTFDDSFGTENDSYTIPKMDGVAYFIDNAMVEAGTYPVTNPNMVIVAGPQPGYMFGPDIPSQYFGNFTSNPVIEDIEIEPFAPDFIDLSGTENDAYVIPEDDRVTYFANGVKVDAGTHPSSGSIIITIEANEGYTISPLTATYFSASFSPDVTDVTIAYPAGVTRADQPGKSKDTYTVTAATGVEYFMNGEVIEPGTYPGVGTVIIDARPLANYVFMPDADDHFEYTFSNEVQFSKPFKIMGNLIFIPEIEGLEYSLNGVVTPWGDYEITEDSTVTVRALDGYTAPAGAVLNYNFTFVPAEVPTDPTDPTVPVEPTVPGEVPTNPTAPGESPSEVPTEVPAEVPTVPGDVPNDSNVSPDAITPTGNNVSNDLGEDANGVVSSKENNLAETGVSMQAASFLGLGGLLTALGIGMTKLTKRRKA